LIDKLEDILLKYIDKKFVIIEPGGNNGDRLIYMGMEKKLRELGIDYTLLQYRYSESLLYYGPWRRILRLLLLVSKFSNGLEMAINKLDSKVYRQTQRAGKIKVNPAHVILIHGGGNIDDLWVFGLRLLKNVIFNNPENVIIIGPQSYRFWKTNFPKLFQEAKQEIYLFCREKYSYNLLRSMNLPKNVNIGLSHDTSLYLSKEDFHPRHGDYDLVCLRTDKESILPQKMIDLIRLPRNRTIDLKQSEKGVVVNDISLLKHFGDFANLVEGSRKVFTDRLHVAILATILGKDTTLYPNSYYKNKGVYEYSLFRYSNFKFVDSPWNSKEFEVTIDLLLTHLAR
jgi:exopolysaccharide biosynthesis predicted pyruvyltransferase EpsI